MKTVYVDSKKVKELCDNTLKAIFRIRDKVDQLLPVKERRSRKKYKFFGPVITETVDECRERLKREGYYPCQWNREVESHVTGLSNAANLASTLGLSHKDVAHLLQPGYMFRYEEVVDADLLKYGITYKDKQEEEKEEKDEQPAGDK